MAGSLQSALLQLGEPLSPAHLAIQPLAAACILPLVCCVVCCLLWVSSAVRQHSLLPPYPPQVAWCHGVAWHSSAGLHSAAVGTSFSSPLSLVGKPFGAFRESRVWGLIRPSSLRPSPPPPLFALQFRVLFGFPLPPLSFRHWWALSRDFCPGCAVLPCGVSSPLVIMRAP